MVSRHWSRKGFLDGPSSLEPAKQPQAADTDPASPLTDTQGLAIVSDHVGDSLAARRQDAFDRPSPSQPHDQRSFFDSEPTSPLSHAERLTAVREKSNATGVLPLLQRSGPSAVIGAIPKGSVDTVNRVLWPGPCAHIIKEMRKGRAPAFADGDAFFTIQVVVLVVGVVATALHILPTLVLWRTAVSKTRAMFRIAVQMSRITRSHLNLLNRFAVVRAAGRPNRLAARSIVSATEGW